MKRRTLLVSASAAAAAGGAAWYAGKVATPAMDSMAGMDMMNMPMDAANMAANRIGDLPVGQPLPELPRLYNTARETGVFEAVLETGPSSREFVPGLVTPVLAYNDAVPGAVIEVTEGDRVKVTFRNRIPGQESTIHWHGLEVPADQDGNPTNPVASGEERFYEFTIPPSSAGSYWYHPHPHGLTGEQVYRGLAAPFIVRGKSDPLPQELGDTILFITTISLNSDGSIAQNTPADDINGREGDHVLVNGAKQPVISAAPGSSRWFRLYNATSARFLRLSFEGHYMTLVGTDGGLIATPVRGLREIVLAPAERAEVVVDFHVAMGHVALVAMPYERGWMGGGKPASEPITLLTVYLSGPSQSLTPVPERLREIVALGAPAASKRIEFGENMGMANGAMTMDFLIDGKSFDMNRTDLTSRAGDVELWEIVNTTDMDHPFHIHGGQFQIVEREIGGKITPDSVLAWKDTVNTRSKETVRLKMRQVSAGLRMYHCHILEHEDAGMMGMLDVA